MLVRAFIALSLDARAKRKLRTLLASPKCLDYFSIQKFNWIDEKNWHLTLRFLGEIDATALLQRLPELTSHLAFQCVFDYELEKIAPFPNSSSNLLAAWVYLSPSLEALMEKINGVTFNDARCESRPFRPHITLAKNVEPTKIEVFRIKRFLLQANQVVLYESCPPQTYRPLIEFQLIKT